MGLDCLIACHDIEFAECHKLGHWTIAGVVLYAIGLTMESVSDVQKYIFKQRQSDKSAICDKGFFAWTRHPNYFGEINFVSLLTTNNRGTLTLFSHLYDCCLSSSRWLRPWRSLQGPTRLYPQPLLPHNPPNFRFHSKSGPERRNAMKKTTTGKDTLAT